MSLTLSRRKAASCFLPSLSVAKKPALRRAARRPRRAGMDGRSSCPCPCLTITFEKCVRAPSVPRLCPVRAPPVPRPSCARPCPRMRVWTSTDVCMRRIAILCSTRFRGAPSHFAGGRARSARLLCSTQFSGARLSHFLRLDGRAARGFSAALSLVGRAYRIFCGWTGAQRAASLQHSV